MISVSILGLGLIGGSIAKALKNSNLPVFISAFDKKEILLTALDDRTIDNALDSVDDSLESEIIFLSFPINLSLSTFEYLIPRLKDNTIISDVCGVKGIFENKWNELNSGGIYIGGHPMTGKEKGGYSNSDPLLFENAVYILSDKRKEKISEKLITVIKSLGARITFLDPYLHDKIVSYVSHLPQLLAVALTNSAAKNEKDTHYLDFTAGGFRDMTRIASSDFSIWEDIIKYNRDYILISVNDFILQLENCKKNISDNNFSDISDYFESSRKKRDEIPMNTKGFINPLVDIFVFVKDEPGILSKITTTLFNNGINIKDIELLKIREGTGGTFRLSFVSETDAQNAKKLLEQIGFFTK